MQEKYLLSIIIPVYNAEKYIKTCLDSIVNYISSYRIQIIAVDDGSIDRTAEILQEYKEKYGITVISQKNSGVSVARNAGMEAVEGKYLTFVDADDIVLESFWTSIDTWANTETDMVIYDYIDIDEAGSFIQDVSVTKNINELQDVKVSFLLGHLFNTCWGKIYLSKIVRDNHIQFPINMAVGEDMLWMAKLINSIYTIKCVNCNAYGYRQNNSGAMVQLRKELTNKRINEFAKGIEIKIQMGQDMNWSKEIREKFYQSYADISVAKINFAIKSIENFNDLCIQVNNFLNNKTVTELFNNAIRSKTTNIKRRIVCIILMNKVFRKLYLKIKHIEVKR